MKTRNLFLVLVTTFAIVFTSCSEDDGGSVSLDIRSELFVTSNGSGDITVFDMSDESQTSTTKIMTTSTANEGIHYDGNDDELIVASRSGTNVNAYSNIESNLLSATVALSASVSSTSDLSNPRAMAVSGNTVVISDNENNQFFVYTRSGSNLTLQNTFDIDFAVWGVEFVGNDLYAVVDSSSDLVVFSNFTSNSTDGSLAATKRVTVEGIVRTHGLTYSAEDNLMVMTDIGDAGNTSDDGGFQIITNFTNTFNTTADAGTIASTSQTRVSGSSTKMGNPIDVAYDADSNTVFIAEIGNGGGRVLSFTNIGSGGDITPDMDATLSGASSLYFYSEK